MKADVSTDSDGAGQQVQDTRATSEARMHALLQAALHGIIGIDERGIIQTVNPAAERLFRYAEGEVIGQNVKILTPLPYREEHDGYLARYLGSPRYQMIGSSPVMQKVVQMIEKVATTEATVLIRGASGTGKELVARALHHNSLRRERPMVTINCAALQETLLESELFGHEKGAFTGALQTEPGLIEVAEGGTLFIDEVAEMSPSMQAKLLRVLEDGHYRRVGSTKECNANVRVIAATNKPLEEERKAGRFREDLFYRLNVVSIMLPPLRERRQDIPRLVEHFATTRQLGKARYQVHPEAMQAILSYEWPGNIRELANVLERAQILAEDNLITLDDLPEAMHAGTSIPTDTGPLNLSEMEHRNVRAALQQAQGNKVQAAKALGISRRALYRLITKYGLEVPAEDGCRSA